MLLQRFGLARSSQALQSSRHQLNKLIFQIELEKLYKLSSVEPRFVGSLSQDQDNRSPPWILSLLAERSVVSTHSASAVKCNHKQSSNSRWVGNLVSK
jgi:hypothetical protein